ncbi:MAG TPA: M1 family metallopeptidase [Pyrinomonadaceae bacterium]|jgi:aminopeptidase N
MNNKIVTATGILLLFITSFFVVPVKAQSQASTASASFDVINYTAQIEPDIPNKAVKGKVSLQFISLVNNLREIQLNAGVLEIDAVRENKIALNFEKKDGILIVSFQRPAKLNEKRQIEIDYHGVPKAGIRFFSEQNQIYTVFSTSQWMPCVDAPSDRATFRLNLITPKDLKTVGNGRFIKQTGLPNNKISTLWEQKNPIPTYIFGFAAGNFREVRAHHKGVELRYLASPQFSENEIKRIFRDSADMLDFFENKAGVKYPGKEYTQILAAGGVQQEMSGFAAMNDEYGRGVLENERENWLGAHEFSHQWWGNMVTNLNWNHFWLNEGIATFMVAAYKEHRFGREEYLKEIEKLRVRYERVREAGKDKSLEFPDWNNPSREDRSIVYNKGGYLLHLLREEMGEQAFWKGLQEYTRKYWGKSVTTKDFQQAMQTASNKNLTAFFNEWIYLLSNGEAD